MQILLRRLGGMPVHCKPNMINKRVVTSNSAILRAEPGPEFHHTP